MPEPHLNFPHNLAHLHPLFHMVLHPHKSHPLQHHLQIPHSLPPHYTQTYLLSHSLIPHLHPSHIHHFQTSHTIYSSALLHHNQHQHPYPQRITCHPTCPFTPHPTLHTVQTFQTLKLNLVKHSCRPWCARNLMAPLSRFRHGGTHTAPYCMNTTFHSPGG